MCRWFDSAPGHQRILKSPSIAMGFLHCGSGCLYGCHVGLCGAGPAYGPLSALRRNMPPHCRGQFIALRCGPVVALHWALRQGEFGGVRCKSENQSSPRRLSNAYSQQLIGVGTEKVKRQRPYYKNREGDKNEQQADVLAKWTRGFPD